MSTLDVVLDFSFQSILLLNFVENFNMTQLSSVGRAYDCRSTNGYRMVAGSIPAAEILFYFSFLDRVNIAIIGLICRDCDDPQGN